MARFERAELERKIADAAESFARELIGLIGRMTVNDLAMAGLAAAPAPRAGGVTASKTLSAPAAAATGVKRKRSWPICSVPSCGKSYYPASGKARFCYDHFLSSGGRHPSKRK